jgi:hypothetical protein
MIDPKQVLAWCAVPAAIGGVVLYMGSHIDAVAQDTARAEVEKKMVPVQRQLEELVDQGRRDEDFKLTVYCLDRKYQDLPEPERQAKCAEESEARWDEWRRKDAETEQEKP